MSTPEQLIDFIAASPSTFHAVHNLGEALTREGYQELYEHTPWTLVPGGRYFVCRNGSSIIAFRMPEEPVRAFQMAVAHSDSPSFKIKEHPEMVHDGYVTLNVEKYGSLLCAPWFDRPLSMAGRVVVQEGDKLSVRLVNVDEDLLVIPNVAIHMDRTQNHGHDYSLQKDMIPLLGDASEPRAYHRILGEAAGTDPQNIIASEVSLYNRMRGTIWGAHKEFLSAPKLDDLECTFSLFQGFITSQGHPNVVPMVISLDNEEVGSSTRQGAFSTFLPDVLHRIANAAGMDADAFRCALASSFMISADNAHAVHPNHPEKADPICRPKMNEGVVVKFHSEQKYTTDSISASVFRHVCHRAGVPTQTFFNHSDIPGGSTLGNLIMHQVSVSCVDVGLPQLAMHSPYETAGVKDLDYLIAACREFYNTYVEATASGFTFHSIDQ